MEEPADCDFYFSWWQKEKPDHVGKQPINTKMYFWLWFISLWTFATYLY